MNINLNWLREYIPFDFTVEELVDRLTMVGLEIEETWQVEPLFRGVVVGDIVRVEKHPAADKLKICRVDVGGEVLSIVCGAPNVSEGQRVPVARIDAVLGEDRVIESVTIRGVQSEGMICSEQELGLGDNHSGILVLNKSKYVVGADFRENSTGKDMVLEINVTPNRPDCLSHLGIAREVGVIIGKKSFRPNDTVKESERPVEEWITIDIEDPRACPRYCARVVYDITVEPSPLWLKTRLESVGIRSINNVVDVNNYVMMETGQPLHGFDYDLVKGKRIIVRKAWLGEIFVTLDSEERRLTPEDLLICDGERGIALAGVMGGLNSEVSERTQCVLLESAYFDPMTIRKTAKRFGMTTEASMRFERGADPNNTLYAINRAAQLLYQVAGGKAAQGVFDVYPQPIKDWEVSLRFSRIPIVLGTEISREKVISILKGLGLGVKGNEPIRVTVPTFRPDLKGEIDLIEEVIRHHGYEKVEPNLGSTLSLNYLQNREQNLTEEVRDILVGLGFLEALNNSLVSKEHVLLTTPEIKAVAIQNPLSPETAFLRTGLIPGLLDSVQWNQNRSVANLRLFEIGRTFEAKEKSLPDERLQVVGALSGFTRSSPFWGEKEIMVNFFHLKGIVETFLDRLHINEVTFELEKHNSLISETAMDIQYRGRRVGILGEVKKTVLDHWDIRNSVFIFEISVSVLLEVLPQRKKYESIPRFPSIKRDLAVVVDENVPVGALKELIFKEGGEKLASAEIFDLYRGQQIPSGKKSVAFSLTFLSQRRTLTEEEVDPIISSMVNVLESSFSASLRS